MSDDEMAERRAWVANVRAILALPTMRADDRTIVRRAIVYGNAHIVEATIAESSISGEGVFVHVEYERIGASPIEAAIGVNRKVVVFASDDPLPDWHTELVPA